MLMESVGHDTALRLAKANRLRFEVERGSALCADTARTAFRTVTILALAVVAAVACAAPATPTASQDAERGQTMRVAVGDSGSYVDVDASSLAAMLKNKDFVFVNVHIPYEGEIENTDLFIPYDQIEGNLAKMPADRGAKLVLYCRSGHMSTIAARALVELGYTNVWELRGGMIAWAQSGYPIVQESR